MKKKRMKVKSVLFHFEESVKNPVVFIDKLNRKIDPIFTFYSFIVTISFAISFDLSRETSSLRKGISSVRFIVSFVRVDFFLRNVCETSETVHHPWLKVGYAQLGGNLIHLLLTKEFASSTIYLLLFLTKELIQFP